METNGVTGIIISLEPNIIDRVFHHRPIIPMFVDEFPSELAPGDTIFLYEKGGGRVLEGEGVMVEFSSETVDDVRKQGPELCLSDQELDQYVQTSGRSGNDRMLVLKLRDAIKYVRPLRCSIPVGSDGVYVTKETFSAILAENT